MNMRIWPVILGILLSLCFVGCTTRMPVQEGDAIPHGQSFSKEVCKTVESNYLLYLPDGYEDSAKQWPLLLFLHGAGERGDDLSLVETHGPPKLIAKEGKALSLVVVAPQCPDGEWWSGGKQIDTLNALLDHIIATCRIDEERIYVTGLSMGGFGTWRLAAEYPDRFAAIAPICGRGDPFMARMIPHLPAWVFHGAKDDVVPLQASQEMVDALKKAGGKVEFTVYPEAGHDSWTETYNNPALYEWFLTHTRSGNKRQGSTGKESE